MTSGQPLQDLPELLPPPGLALLAGQHQVGVEVVRDEGGGQVPEIQLQHRTVSRLETLILGFLLRKKGNPTSFVLSSQVNDMIKFLTQWISCMTEESPAKFGTRCSSKRFLQYKVGTFL